ncbi:MAG: S1 RNA-binding domain-containing protein [Chloroflexi bacterium]|nr:S1 RNA-binding domain-containing protein [Chloroflexota bacterium]
MSQVSSLERLRAYLQAVYTSFEKTPPQAVLQVNARNQPQAKNVEEQSADAQAEVGISEKNEMSGQEPADLHINDPQQQTDFPTPAEEQANVWDIFQMHFEHGDILEGRVVNWNRGGLLVNVNQRQGFVPASHLVSMPHTSDVAQRENYLAAQVGKNLRLRIIELDRQRDRLVLSERACGITPREELALLDRISPGDRCRGLISNICNFGAFVDLGGVDGLIHISELSWQRIHHPSEILQVGDEVEAYVLSVDREHKRIALSLKRLRPDPWAQLEERYHVGQVVQGTITNVVSFGAFARLEEGLEGLIHISELAEGNFLHPRNVVHEGDVVLVRIISMDPVNHRLGLSMRQVHQGATPNLRGDHIERDVNAV